MPIDFACDCGKLLSVEEHLAGQTGTCPYCGREVTYPGVYRRPERLVVTASGSEEGDAPDRRAAGERPPRREGRRLLLGLGLLLVAAAVLVGYHLWQQVRHERNLQESRRSLVELWERAQAVDDGTQDLAAYQLYRSVVQRAEACLQEGDAGDPEVSQIAAAAARRAEELDPRRPPGEDPPAGGD
jgi:hypothetical protein